MYFIALTCIPRFISTRLLCSPFHFNSCSVLFFHGNNHEVLPFPPISSALLAHTNNRPRSKSFCFMRSYKVLAWGGSTQLAKTICIYLSLLDKMCPAPPELVAKHGKYKTKTVRVRNSKLGSTSPAFCYFSFSKFGGKIVKTMTFILRELFKTRMQIRVLVLDNFCRTYFRDNVWKFKDHILSVRTSYLPVWWLV